MKFKTGQNSDPRNLISGKTMLWTQQLVKTHVHLGKDHGNESVVMKGSQSGEVLNFSHARIPIS